MRSLGQAGKSLRYSGGVLCSHGLEKLPVRRGAWHAARLLKPCLLGLPAQTETLPTARLRFKSIP